MPIIKNVQNASASRDRSGAWRWQGGNIWRNPQTCRCGVQKSNASTYPERVACESRRERPAQERESGARLSNPSQVDSSRIRLFTKFQMRAGSIVILTAALLLAPVVPLASPAAAASQPVVSSVSPGSGTIGTPVTITGSGFDYGCTDGQTGQVYFGGQAAANATVTDGAATAVAPTHEAGAVYVQVEDCLGDLSAVSSAGTFVYPAPVVSSVSPGSGTIGTPVTITGSGFNYGCTDGQTGQVYFGGQAAANATVTDGAATAVAPTHEAGAVYVQVEDCLGDLSAVSSAGTFVYPAPVVSSVSPGSGTIGTPVTITGSGFNYGCTDGQTGQVYFGGQAAANATVTDGAATAVAPTHEAGAVYVQVEDCLGDESGTRRADRYTYLPSGPSFFGLHVYETESREATIIAQLPKPGVLALRVMRVVSDGRLVFAGLVSFGQQPRGRSLIHWNFRINHHLLGPGRYELTLHGRRAGLLSAPAAPGARTLLILKDHRVRLPR